MALSRVDLTSEVFRVCVTHALTTEVEEVMGLLLGDVMYDERGAAIARIWVAVPQIRTDRRKDRVEASPEQLAQASAAAERYSEESGRRTRVIGWYHSHPHITVLPSHVDVRTQAMYQNLDDGFIGLIFSVFNQSEDKAQRVQMTAFQAMKPGHGYHTPEQRGSWEFDSPMAAAISASMADARLSASSDGSWVERKVPLAVIPALNTADEATMRDLLLLCRVLFEEEQQAFQQATAAAMDGQDRIDPLTAVHQAAEYQQHLAHLIELVLAPALESVQAAHTQALIQQQQLRDWRDRLAHRAANAHPSGPSQVPPPLPPHLLPLPQLPEGQQNWPQQAGVQIEATQQHQPPPPPELPQPSPEPIDQQVPAPIERVEAEVRPDQASERPVIVTVTGGYYDGIHPQGDSRAQEAGSTERVLEPQVFSWPPATDWDDSPSSAAAFAARRAAAAAAGSSQDRADASGNAQVAAATAQPPPPPPQGLPRLPASQGSSAASLQGQESTAPPWRGDPFSELVEHDLASFNLGSNSDFASHNPWHPGA